MNMGAICVGFASNTQESITSNIIDFYKKVVKDVYRVTENIFLDKRQYLFIPVNNAEMDSKPNKISVEIENYYLRNTVPDLILIDMSKPYNVVRGQIFNLVTAIDFLVKKNKNIKILLLVQETFSEQDFILKGLKKYLDNNVLIIIDNEGICLPNSTKLTGYIELRDLIITKPIELLKYKLIRRLGHFKSHHGKTKICNRYFYDGSKCTSEFIILLKEKIYSFFKTEDIKNTLIVYHASLSPWLEDVVTGLKLHLNIPTIPFSELKNKKLKRNSKIFIIVDLIDTGKTVEKIYLEILKKISENNIHIISVLSTIAKQPNEDICVKKNKGTSIKAYSLLNVDLKPHKNSCPMCEMKIPVSNFKDEGNGYLTTYDMWDIIDDVGMIEELNVPKNRKSKIKKWVPNGSRIIDEYGAWIVFKLKKLLEENDIDTSDLTIICPKETVPEKFAIYLKYGLNINTIIQIPKEEVLESNLENIEMWSDEEWFKKMINLTNDEIIVLDEFQASGGTFTSITELLKKFKKNIKCYVPIIDFNPKLSKECSNIFSLYQIQRCW